MELLDQTIGSIACDIPGATRIFHQHKLDFCCGGGKSLREAAQRRGVDTAVLTAELEQLRQSQQSGRDWRDAPVPELIMHILERFHERHREQLPELIRLARRVEEVHGDKPECPLGLAALLEGVEQELESHMQKEEQILFPLLLRGYCQQSLQPILVMRHEHDQHGDNLERLAQLTNDITPPANACNTWRALYAGLAQLREDLMQHIHLENNVLFPQAEEMAAGRVDDSGAAHQACACH
ncbi:MAG: putative regulator of cell morphosis and signaling [Burkholderiaceae bacterium]|nr:putative regulator of cell morphosis and signaling [Burkholderiaceae bacterium]